MRRKNIADFIYGVGAFAAGYGFGVFNWPLILVGNLLLWGSILYEVTGS